MVKLPNVYFIIIMERFDKQFKDQTEKISYLLCKNHCMKYKNSK
jgi:hypothetical protein